MAVQPGTTPLDHQEIAQLESELAKLPADDFGRRLVCAFLYTAAHPAALSDPLRWRMRIRDDGQLEWRRPKTRAPVWVPLPPEIRPWMGQFLNELSIARLHPTRLNQIVHETCSRFGMPQVTPRGLRHTLGQRAWERWHDLRVVMQLLGCSMSTAARYANAEINAEKREILDGGWSAPAAASR